MYFNNNYDFDYSIENFAENRRDYHERPTLVFFKDDDEAANENSLYIGCEIEMESKYDDWSYNDYDHVAHELSQAFTYKYNQLFMYYNEDGSLHDSGLECITQPFTKKYYKTHKTDFTNFFKIATNEGMIAHDSGRCGMHFHINKNYFGETFNEKSAVIDKIIYLFEYYKSELQNMSRRKCYDYCKFYSQTITTADIGKLLSKKDDLREQAFEYGHHRVVNNEHSNTLEIRLFQSTLLDTTFFATLDFLFAMIEFVKNNELENCSLYNIVKFANSTDLNNYLQKRGIKLSRAKVKRLDLQFIKKQNKAFDKLQKMEATILSNLLNDLKVETNKYFNELQKANNDIQKATQKNIKNLNTKKLYQSTSNVFHFNLLNLYNSKNTDIKHLNSAFYNVLSGINDEKKDNEEFTTKLNFENYQKIYFELKELI